MAHYALFYDLAPEYMERRAEFRTEHLRRVWQSHERGELLLAGALTEPVDTALLVFVCDSPSVPEAFAADDPYVKNGLVRSFRVRQWVTVAGDLAASPMRLAEG
jgi:uncharacterized protein YciI